MSREIRRVPADWEHPRYQESERYGWEGKYKPLYDEDFEAAMTKWWQEASKWVEQVRQGQTPEHWYADDEKESAWGRANPFKAYAAWCDNPPDPDAYRDRFTSEPTAYQIYETVTEGTPVSPVFQTEEELLAWCQHDHEKWPALSEGAARRFIAASFAPSGIFSPSTGLVRNAQVFEYFDEGK